jgi:hypothetical protein
MTDGPGAACNQHYFIGDWSIREDAAMCRHSRHPQAGALGEACVSRQWDGTYGGLHRILGGGAERATDLRLVQPDPFTEAGLGHVRANEVDDPRAILVRNDPGEFQASGQPLAPLPV